MSHTDKKRTIRSRGRGNQYRGNTTPAIGCEITKTSTVKHVGNGILKGIQEKRKGNSVSESHRMEVPLQIRMVVLDPL